MPGRARGTAQGRRGGHLPTRPPPRQQQAKAIDRINATTSDVARIQLAKINAKWMRECIAYDPLPALRAARVPLLAITGTKDAQVDATDIETILDAAPVGTEAHAIPDVDHVLRHEPGQVSNPRKYGAQVTKPIDPRVLDLIIEWLRRVASQRPLQKQRDP